MSAQIACGEQGSVEGLEALEIKASSGLRQHVVQPGSQLAKVHHLGWSLALSCGLLHGADGLQSRGAGGLLGCIDLRARREE